MKNFDYIVQMLEVNGIRDIFGIPGVGCGHLTDSLRNSGVECHLSYHEQGAAFEACAYGQASGNMGVAFATAGPGATNLLTGIANAYVDSVPTLYIVGDKDSASLRGNLPIRQKASQEVNIVGMSGPVTKWSYQMSQEDDFKRALDKAFFIAKSGRPGPVLLDIPSDVLKGENDAEPEMIGVDGSRENAESVASDLLEEVSMACRPLLLAGGGVKQTGMIQAVKELSRTWNIPIVATIVCDDELFSFENYIGFIGVDGDSAANNAINNCDLLITLGARLNVKETGNDRGRFAVDANILRVDVDSDELSYRLGKERPVECDIRSLMPIMLNADAPTDRDTGWLNECISSKAVSHAPQSSNIYGDQIMEEICSSLPEGICISLGIGSHRRWFISRRVMKKGWRVFQSAGLASMGYALPAGIGIHYATKMPVVCMDGDGGILMNIQELQQIRRENLPVNIIVFNNHCLGDIMEFQKKVFRGNYMGTTENTGYMAADYEGIARAFHLEYAAIECRKDHSDISFDVDRPRLTEVIIPSNE